MTDAIVFPIKGQMSLGAAVALTFPLQQVQETTSAPEMLKTTSEAKGDEASSKVDSSQDKSPEDTATTFTKFAKFPPEIQTMVWEQCPLPRRIVTPWYFSATAARPSIDTPIHEVCHEARQVAFRNGSLKTALRYIYESEAESGGTYEPLRCWFNKETDFIYLGGHMHNCVAMLLAPLDGSDGNEIAHLAVHEPETNLLISVSMIEYILPYEVDNLTLVVGWLTDDTLGHRLYKMFLKSREHVFLEMWHIDITLAGAARDEAVRMGLVSQQGEEVAPAVIHLDDMDALEKYVRLMGMSPHTYIPISNTDRARNELDNLIKCGGFKVGTYAQKTLVCFVEEVVLALCIRGGMYIPVGGVNGTVDAYGNLNKDHPMLVELGLSVMPRWTPVAVFQLLDEDRAVKEDDIEWPAEGYSEQRVVPLMCDAARAGEYDTWAAMVRQLLRVHPDPEKWSDSWS